MEGTDDRKRKKDPGLAVFSPTVLETGTSTVVRRGKKLDDETSKLYGRYTFQKGHQLAVIGTAGGGRTNKSA
jgi:hypothetical protein